MRKTTKQITPRQQDILTALVSFIKNNGYPPSIRELGELTRLKSPASVQHHLKKLEELGYISRPAGKSRVIELKEEGLKEEPTSQQQNAPQNHSLKVSGKLSGGSPNGKISKTNTSNSSTLNKVSVPLVGSVAAGTGVLATEEITDTMMLPPELTSSGEMFILKVRGDSMRDAAILNGDWVVVRSQSDANNGDIVVAAIDDEEATVKQFFKRGPEILLVPANPDFDPINLPAAAAKIYGKVISVMRRL